MAMGRPMTPMCRVMTSMRGAIANMRHSMMCLGFVMAGYIHEAMPRLSCGHGGNGGGTEGLACLSGGGAGGTLVGCCDA